MTKGILKLLALAAALVFAIAGDKMTTTTNLVKIGAGPEDAGKFTAADVLIIDGQYFEKEDVAALHKKGFKKIYSYLNVGSVENFRDYYKDYEDITIGDYENWPEERFVDVSSKKWQKFIRGKAKELTEKGFDGLFLDNADVYYNFPTDEIYNGLVSTLKKLNTVTDNIIINGGDVFVTKYLKETKDGEKLLFTAVNQESVFTAYDFENKEYGEQTEDTTDYLLEYLDLAKASGLTVYTIEYTDDTGLAKEAAEKSAKNGFICYVSDDIELK